MSPERPAWLPADGGCIVLCGTPIGNLGDVTDRLREALSAADIVACEDTRRTRALFSALDIAAPKLIACRSDQEDRVAPDLIAAAQSGAIVAVVADAGMPAISDPGGPIAAAATEAGVPLDVVPGPSAVSTALALSGLSHSRYTFVGFLPRVATQLQHLFSETAGSVVVAFESPHRIAATLESLREMAPERRCVVCREMTKRHQEVVHGTAAELAAEFADRDTRGEVVLVIDRDDSAAAVDADIADQVRLVRAIAEEGVKLRQAARIVSDATGVRTRTLYNAAIDSSSR